MAWDLVLIHVCSLAKDTVLTLAVHGVHTLHPRLLHPGAPAILCTQWFRPSNEAFVYAIQHLLGEWPMCYYQSTPFLYMWFRGRGGGISPPPSRR